MAITGTRTCVTFTIRWTPPKIIKAVKTTSIAPIILGLTSKASPTEVAIVLDCTALKIKPKLNVNTILKISLKAP